MPTREYTDSLIKTIKGLRKEIQEKDVIIQNLKESKINKKNWH